MSGDGDPRHVDVEEPGADLLEQRAALLRFISLNETDPECPTEEIERAAWEIECLERRLTAMGVRLG